MKTALIVLVTLGLAGGAGFLLYKAYLPTAKRMPPENRPGTAPGNDWQNAFTKLGINLGGVLLGALGSSAPGGSAPITKDVSYSEISSLFGGDFGGSVGFPI